MTTSAAFDDRDGYIWFDGKMLPWRDAGIHVLNHSLHYGGSVFEGERVYSGTIFKLQEHSDRLIRSGGLIDMKIPYSAQEIMDASREVVQANAITDGYVRPIAWRGSEQMAVSSKNCTVHVAIACWPWPKYFFPKNGDDAGLALMTTSWRRPDPRTAPVQSKASGIYMIGTMAKNEAERNGYDDVLMYDYQGRVAESSGANLFMVKDGVLKTPVPECFLNGLTRQTIIQLASEEGIPVEETHITPEELKDAHEVFLTGTAAEVAPVGAIDDTRYVVGEITHRLKDAYADLVRQKSRKTAVA